MARPQSEDSSERNPSARKNHLLSIEILLPLAFYYALVIPHFNYVPLWDSLENLEKYLFLPRQQLSFDNLLLMHNGHPSLGYFWPFWIGQWLFPSQMLVVHVINLLIGSLAIIAFSQLAIIAFRGAAAKSEIVLLAIAFAVQPVFVAYAVNMSPDYGVLAYFLATLWLLYSGRLGWAALTGVMLLFSKEIGVVTYLLLVVFYLSGAIRKYCWSTVWPLAIPLLTFALYCSYQWSKQQPVFPWAAHWLKHETVWQTYFPNPFKWDFKMACLGPFVLEFQWIFSAVILLGLTSGVLARPPVRFSLAQVSGWFHGISLPLRCFIVLLLGCLYVDSRTVNWTNQRYFLTLYPLVLLAFFAAMLQLRVKEKARAAVLAVTVIILFACNFRTLDPFSKAVAGTFHFGKHELLSISTIRPDRGACNRDSMVYNLEHTHFSGLLDMAFARIRPTENTAIAMASDAWWVYSRLDSKTYHRTESTQRPFIKLRRENPERILRSENKPEIIFVMALPNLDNRKVMLMLAPFYELMNQYTFTEDGYELQVFELARKTPARTTGTSFRDNLPNREVRILRS